MKKYLPKIALLTISLIVSLYLFEIILRASDTLPFNGYKDGIRYTWGHPVINNSLGFREKEIGEKTKEFRVMVIGDSYTWGAGLSNEERFTDLSNTYNMEVLNFGVSGADFLDYYDILLEYYSFVKPDVVVIAYCSNDTQQKLTAWSWERQVWEFQYKRAINTFKAKSGTIGLGTLGERTGRSIYKLAECCNAFPDWVTALNRTYDPESDDWKRAIMSLAKIKYFCDKNKVPVILFTLNHGIYFDKGTDYSNPGEKEKIVLGWWKQTEQLANALGYYVCNVQDVLIASQGRIKMNINRFDMHPSVVMNELYAHRLKSYLNIVIGHDE